MAAAKERTAEMIEPPLPHLTGDQKQANLEPLSLQEQKMRTMFKGVAVIVLMVLLYLAKNTYQVAQQRTFDFWFSLSAVLILCGMSIYLFVFGMRYRDNVAQGESARSKKSGSTSEASAQPLKKQHKVKPLLLALICLTTFLFEGFIGVRAYFFAPRGIHPPLDSLLFSLFCTVSMLIGTIWCFTWWLQQGKEGTR